MKKILLIPFFLIAFITLALAIDFYPQGNINGEWDWNIMNFDTAFVTDFNCFSCISPEDVGDIDKENIETDLNTFVDIAGDGMTGTLYIDATGGNKAIFVHSGDSNFVDIGFTGFIYGNGSKLTGIVATAVDINGQDLSIQDMNSRYVEADFFFGNGSGLTGVAATTNWSDVNAHLVPYVGADYDLNLGTHTIKARGDANFVNLGFSGYIFGDGSKLTNLPTGTDTDTIRTYTALGLPIVVDNDANTIGFNAYIPSEQDIDLNAMAWDTNSSTKCDGNNVANALDQCIDIGEFYKVGASGTDTDTIRTYTGTAPIAVNSDTNIISLVTDFNNQYWAKTDLNNNFYGKNDTNANFVPYVGADYDLNMGTYTIKARGDSNFVNIGFTGYIFGDGSKLTGITSVAGSNNQIQYNDNGTLGASQYFTFTDTNNELNLDGLSIFKSEKFYNFNFTGFQYGTETWSVSTEAQFDLGTYTNTDFNAAGSFVGLTLGSNNGTYTSSVYDASLDVEWKTLSWEFKDFDCPSGMVFIPKINGFCIDQYEASHSDATFCANGATWSGGCSANFGTSAVPASVADRIPWTTISQTNAATACAAAGKHLCSSSEWMAAANLNGQIYDLSNATTQTTCIVDSTLYCLDHSQTTGEACNTGSNKNTSPSNCKSSQGVYDLIGNVYEWTSDVVNVDPDSFDNAWQYPNDANLVSNLWANATPSPHYGNDGVYTSSTKAGRAVVRGGYWSNGSIAGLFAVYLYNAPSITYNYLGFRCCTAT